MLRTCGMCLLYLYDDLTRPSGVRLGPTGDDAANQGGDFPARSDPPFRPVPLCEAGPRSRNSDRVVRTRTTGPRRLRYRIRSRNVAL